MQTAPVRMAICSGQTSVRCSSSSGRKTGGVELRLVAMSGHSGVFRVRRLTDRSGRKEHLSCRPLFGPETIFAVNRHIYLQRIEFRFQRAAVREQSQRSRSAVRGNSATDRRSAAKASTDMTPRVIAAIGLKRRAPKSRRLPSDDHLPSECAFAGSEWHRVPHRRSPIRVECSTFRSIRDRATVSGAWAESTEKSRIKDDKVTP